MIFGWIPFWRCAATGTTRAAEELNITQPAVTQHIQYLQSYYGVKLFSYQNKRLALTEEAAAQCRAVHAPRRGEAETDVKDLRLGRRSIRFGATLTIGEYLLPERLAAYMKRNPAWMSTCWWKTPRSCCG